MKTYQIRAIDPQDNASLKEIIHSVMPDFGAGGPGFAIHDPEVEAMFEKYSQIRHAYFVVLKGKSVLGGAGLAPLVGLDEPICELQKMYFLPELRGSGAAQDLLTICLQRANELDYKHCYIETLNAMKAAQKLYLKNGFEYIPTPLGSTGHFGCDTFLVKKLIE